MKSIFGAGSETSSKVEPQWPAAQGAVEEGSVGVGMGEVVGMFGFCSRGGAHAHACVCMQVPPLHGDIKSLAGGWAVRSRVGRYIKARFAGGSPQKHVILSPPCPPGPASPPRTAPAPAGTPRR